MINLNIKYKGGRKLIIDTMGHKVNQIKKQPKGIKYIKLYEGLCKEAAKYGKRIDYKSKAFIERFYNNNRKVLQNMRTSEIIEGLKMLNLINLISIESDYIKMNHYKTILSLYYRKRNNNNKKIIC